MKINGKTVPLQFFEHEWGRLNHMKRQDHQLAQMDDMALRRMTEHNVIGQFLLDEYIRADNAKVASKRVDERLKEMIRAAGNEKRFLRKYDLKKSQLPEFKKSIEHSVRREMFMKSLQEKAPTVTEEEAFNYYKENPMRFGTPETVHAAHIVKHTNDGTSREEAEQEIMAVKKELDEGGSFEDLCDKYSDCKGQSGDLGWFPRGHMVQGFEDVVFSMEPGEISDIFETEFGFHIAKLIEKKPAQITPFDNVKDKLLKQMQEQKRYEAIDAFVDSLRAKATIEP